MNYGMKPFLYARMDSTAKVQKTKLQGYQPEMDALKAVVRKQQPLFIEVNKAPISSRLWNGLKKPEPKLCLQGCRGYRVADKIAAGIAGGYRSCS